MRTSTMLKVPAGLIAAVLAVASLAPVAQAQDSGFAAKMKVPFAFQTSTGQHFGPGVYTVRMSGQGTMMIQGTTTSGMATDPAGLRRSAGDPGQGGVYSLWRPVFSAYRLGCREFESPSLQQLES